jgi:hypothetical protein
MKNGGVNCITLHQLLVAPSLAIATVPTPAVGSVEVRTNGTRYAGAPMLTDSSRLSTETSVTIEVIVKDAKVSYPIQMPPASGTVVNGSRTNPQPHSRSFSFFLTATHAGEFTIGPFYVPYR